MTETTVTPTFGQLLRRFRAAAGLSQEQLAERAGISTRAVSDLERGENRQPRHSTLDLLIEALHPSPEDRAALQATVRRARSEQPAQDMASPAPRPPVSRHHNVPLHLTSFIGREREISLVQERLLRPEIRLLILTGPGGTGKTRLALHVASTLLDSFADGVYVVGLAALRDPMLVIPTIAQVLDVRQSGAEPLQDTLTAFLQDKTLLLVLDNFEQVAPASSLLPPLLGACPGLKMIVTSRMVLRVTGAHRLTIPPLALPSTRQQLPLARLQEVEAVRLFVDRALAAQGDFALTEENAAAVMEICRRLDGLPLTIELAAARTSLFPPRALLSRLSNRLTLLDKSPHDAPARQQTLRATLQWSYDLLDAHEQALFARLAVFAGGCTLEAAETICTGEGSHSLDVLAGVDALLDSSLLLHEERRPSEESPADVRVTMLETIRAYASEQLKARGEEAALRHQHAAYYLHLAETAEPELRGPNQGVWASTLEAEHDNLRAALDWSRRNKDPHLGLRLAGALWRFWYIRSYLSEGRKWLEDILSDTGITIAQDRATRAKALLGAGALALFQGDYAHATTRYDEGLTLFRSLDDKDGLATVLNALGVIAMEQGDYGQAMAFCEESLALRREIRDLWGSALVLNNLGMIASEQGDDERASATYAESLALRQSVGDQHGIATALLNLGHVAYRQGNFERATALNEESLSLFRTLQDHRLMGIALVNVGDIARLQGQYARARNVLEEAVALLRDAGDKRGIASSLGSLGFVAHAQGDEAHARRLFQESLSLCHALRFGMGIAYCLEGLAAISCGQGQPEKAARLFGAAAALRITLHSPLPPVERALYERDIAATRFAMTADDFAAAWAAGQALTLDEAVREVLTQTLDP